MTSEMGQQSAIANMSWREFEQFIARLFKALGYVNIQLTPGTGDEGKDIDMELPVPLGGTMRFLVECKHWEKTPVGRPVVQKLHSAVVADPTVGEGIIVTSGRFTSGAVEYAERTGIILIDGDELYRLARSKGIDLGESTVAGPSEAYLRQAHDFALKYDWDQAIANYIKAIEIKPRYAEAYFWRGFAHNTKGDPNLAIADYTRAIETNPDYAEAYLNRGLTYYALGGLQQAVADCTRAIEINPNYAEAYFNRGITYTNLGGYQQAIADYTRAIKINPNYAEAYFNRGKAHQHQDDYQQAVADYTRAIEINPNDTEAYRKRGEAYYLGLGNRQQAMADWIRSGAIRTKRGDWLKRWKRSRLQGGDDAEASAKRRGTYHKLGDYQQAITDCTEAIELNPNHADAYVNRGIAYANLGDYDQAIADYTKAIELDPNYALAYYNRGNAYRKQGDYDQAVADYTKAIEINPDYADAHVNRRIANLAMGSYTQLDGPTTNWENTPVPLGCLRKLWDLLPRLWRRITT